MSKQVYKLPPCPSWQTDKTERWLEDLAAEGLILSRDGFFMGFGIFEQGSPIRMRFRLEPAEVPVGLLADGEPEKVDFHEELGWTYHQNRGQYHIYSTADPTLPELHTDPEIESWAMDKSKKRLRREFFHLIFWILLMPIIRLRFQFLRAFLSAGTAIMLAFFYILLAPLVERGRELLYLRRKMRTIGLTPVTPARETDWKKETFRYTLRRIFSLLCTVLILVGFFRYADVLDERKTYLPDYEGDLPFPTMQDLSGDTTFEPLFKEKKYNYVYQRSDFLAPVILHFKQTGDAGSVDGGLMVEYYELRYPRMADQLAWEYKMYARRQASMSRTREYTELELPPLDVDYAAAFTDIFPSVVLVKGNKLLYTYFYQTDQTPLSLEEWVVPFAEALQ